MTSPESSESSLEAATASALVAYPFLDLVNRQIVGNDADDDTVELRVVWPIHGSYTDGIREPCELRVDRWERVKLAIPAAWHGGDFRLEVMRPVCLLEIIGVRIVSPASSKPAWEMLGRDLAARVRVSESTEVLSNAVRLSILCTGGDAQITLPDTEMPSTELPLTLELGVRVRTDLRSIGHELEARTRAASLVPKQAEISLQVAEEARAYESARADQLLVEIDAVREDANRRELALQTQLKDARAAAEQHATTLHAEIAAARQDVDQRETAWRDQLAAAHAHNQALQDQLTREIEDARAFGDQRAADGERREAAAMEQLHSARRSAEEYATKLLTEIDKAREYGAEREAGLLSELEATRVQLHGELAEAHRKIEEHRGRTRSMQRSLSWRLTLPLRVIARAFGGKRPAQ